MRAGVLCPEKDVPVTDGMGCGEMFFGEMYTGRVATESTSMSLIDFPLSERSWLTLRKIYHVELYT